MPEQEREPPLDIERAPGHSPHLPGERVGTDRARPGSPGAASPRDRGGQMMVDRHRDALLESALHYARQGWPVLPLHSIRRGPLLLRPRLRPRGRQASAHPARVQRRERRRGSDPGLVGAVAGREPRGSHRIDQRSPGPRRRPGPRGRRIARGAGRPPWVPGARPDVPHRRRGAPPPLRSSRIPRAVAVRRASAPGLTCAATAATSSRRRAGIAPVACTSGRPRAIPTRSRSPRHRRGSRRDGPTPASRRRALLRQPSTT